jgi:hypothetical protein
MKKDLIFGEKTYIFNFSWSKSKAFNQKGDLVLVSYQKAFNFKKDIRVYKDESKSEEIFRITARNMLDFGSIYDIIESKNSSIIGCLKRKRSGWLGKESWDILNAKGEIVGIVTEDSLAMAILRRLFIGLIPQTFRISSEQKEVAVYKRIFNPFHNKMVLEFLNKRGKSLDKRVIIATAMLITAIESRD